MNKILVIDPEKCNGCRSCETACSTAKEGESDLHKSRVRLITFHDEYFYYPNVCLQCEAPYCALVCPTGALHKNLETGIVELTTERCVGCKMCLVACPFGSISMIDKLATKCDLCGGDPVCIRFCEPKALTYGEPDDISTGKRVALAEKMKGTRQVEAEVPARGGWWLGKTLPHTSGGQG